MNSFFHKISKHKVLLLSLVFFLCSSFTIRLLAAPFSAPAALSPTCAPGSTDCYVATGAGTMAISGSITSATQGSVLFAGASGVLAQDNSNLFWNDTTNRLGIGTASPTTALDVSGTVNSTAVTTGTITTSGNVGIANASPAYTLDVGSAGYTSGYVPAIAASGADMHITGTYTGTSNATYIVTVDAGNDVFQTPNTFQVTKNGNIVYSGFGMDSAPTAGPFLIGDGISIGFDDSGNYYSDHDTGDAWTITATASGEINATSSYKINTGFFGSQDQSGYNLYLGKDTPFSTNAGTYSTFVGIGAGTATVAGAQNTFIGANAGSSNIGGGLNTAVGTTSGSYLTSGDQNTFLGQQAGTNITTGSNNLFLGYYSTGATAVTSSIALGAQSSVAHNNSIAIGAYATTSAINQMVVGSSNSSINDIYFGNGVTASTAGGVSINASGGNGNNKSGGSITIAGGKGTGTTGAGGSIIFSTSDLGGGAASTLQTLTEKARISSTGNFSIGATPTFQVDANGDITKLRGVTTTFPAANAAGVLTNNGSGTLSWGSAITTIGTMDSETKSANGAVVSGTNLVMQTASGSFPGLVSTGTQTFAGAKTFSSSISATGYTIGGNFFVSQSTINMAIGPRTAGNTFPALGYDLYVGPSAGAAAGASSSGDTFVGSFAGDTETSANNTYVGSQAGSGEDSGGGNTLIGADTGTDMGATSSSNTIIGLSAGSAHAGNIGNYNVLIGDHAAVESGTLSNAVVIGGNGGDAVSGGVSIGVGARANAGIAIGYGARAFSGSEFVVGSSTSLITDVYFGQGKTSAAPSNVSINPTSGVGTDIAGASLILNGGYGTGTGLGGSIVFKTAQAAAGTGSGANSLTTRFTISSTGDVTINSADKGTTGATMSGPTFTVGRNSNATPAQGSINLLDKNGADRYYWADTNGDLCYKSTAPLNGDTCTPVGAQTSTRSTKQDIADYTDYADSLAMIVDAPLHTFRYIKDVEGYGTDSPLVKTRIGFMADEVSPAFMSGNVIDQVTINGLLMASIKELNIKLQNISGLTTLNGSVVDQLVGAVVSLKELIADKVTTKELCVEDVCITKTQLEQLLQQSNISTPAPTAPAPEPEEVITPPATEPEPIVEPAPEPVAEPVAEPTP